MRSAQVLERMQRAAIAGLAVLTYVFSMVNSPSVAWAAPELAPAVVEAAYSKADTDTLISLLKKERAASSLAPLEIDEALSEVAREYATDMIVRGYFGHSSPEGANLSTRLKKAGIQYQKAGENLAGNSSVTPAHQMLMHSPSHKGNILDSEFEKMGIAVVHGGPYGMMIVEVFLTVKESVGAVERPALAP